MKKYYKLVRDKIPDIIKATGANCKTEILNEKDYQLQLYAKMYEELAEYYEADSVEELADLLEVIYAAAAAQGVSAAELDAIREQKAADRGRFDKRVLLLYVED